MAAAVDPIAYAFRALGKPVPQALADRWRGAGDGDPETMQRAEEYKQRKLDAQRKRRAASAP